MTLPIFSSLGRVAKRPQSIKGWHYKLIEKDTSRVRERGIFSEILAVRILLLFGDFITLFDGKVTRILIHRVVFFFFHTTTCILIFVTQHIYITFDRVFTSFAEQYIKVLILISGFVHYYFYLFFHEISNIFWLIHMKRYHLLILKTRNMLMYIYILDHHYFKTR